MEGSIKYSMFYQSLCILIASLLVLPSMNRHKYDMNGKSNIAVVAWNMNCSFTSAHLYLNELMGTHDIIAVSEHALYPCEHYKLNDVNSAFIFDPIKSYAKLDDRQFGKERGHGGVAIGWKTTLANVIKPVYITDCDRVCVVQVNIPDEPFYIVAVYMPHSTCVIADYDEVLKELERVIIELMSKSEVMVIGDINAHFGPEVGKRGWGKTSKSGKSFLNFARQYNMCPIDMGKTCTGPNYSFSSTRGKSYIDHCFITNLMANRAECRILNDAIQNTSDHLPISVNINVRGGIECNGSSDHQQVAWRKATDNQITSLYTNPLEINLNNMCAELEIDLFNENPNIYNEAVGIINDVIQNVKKAVETYSENLPQCKYNKKLKPYWSKELTSLNKANKRVRQEWIDAGRPEDPLHPVKVRYKKAKSDFRREQRRLKYEYEIKCMEEISSTQEIDQRYFWYAVNKTRKKQKRINPILNDNGIMLTDVDDIRNEWNSYYRKLFNCYAGERDGAFENHVDNTLRVVASIELTEIDFLEGGMITHEEVKKQVSKMKCNKAPGWDGITAEHIKNGGYSLYCVIAWILNVVSVSEEIPAQFKKGLIVSIPKAKQNISLKSNHRGITLMPVFYKIYENIMIEREKSYFSDVIHELQGAGQNGCSCLHSSMVLQETIDYHRSRGANVWVAFLDIRKAFDTVWIPGMLYKLYETGMDKKTWRLIRNGYTGYMCAAYVAGRPGEWFEQTRGVHQGAPISMKIYQVYINELIKELTMSLYSVYIGLTNVTAPTFADDLSMIAFHKIGMKSLLSIAHSYSVKWQYEYGMSKCVMMLWGHDTEPNVKLKLGNHVIATTESTKHMGVKLTSNNTLEIHDVNGRIAAAQGVVLAARGLGSYMTPVPPIILSKIYWAIGIKKMLYGCEIKPFRANHIDLLDAAHRKFAKLVQGIPDNTSNCTVLATLGWVRVQSYIAMRKIIFLWTLLYLPTHNIYRRIVMHVLGSVGMRPPVASHSPIKEMYRMAWRYGMGRDIWEFIVHGHVQGSLESRKIATKRIIWETERTCWLSTCALYGKLESYSNALEEIKPIGWWKFAQKHPGRTKQICCVVAIFLGTQPKGMQINFSLICKLCNDGQIESNEHVLMQCPGYGETRNQLLPI